MNHLKLCFFFPLCFLLQSVILPLKLSVPDMSGIKAQIFSNKPSQTRLSSSVTGIEKINRQMGKEQESQHSFFINSTTITEK